VRDAGTPLGRPQWRDPTDTDAAYPAGPRRRWIKITKGDREGEEGVPIRKGAGVKTALLLPAG